MKTQRLGCGGAASLSLDQHAHHQLSPIRIHSVAIKNHSLTRRGPLRGEAEKVPAPFSIPFLSFWYCQCVGSEKMNNSKHEGSGNTKNDNKKCYHQDQNSTRK